MSDRRDRIREALERQREGPELPHFGDWRDLLRGLRGPAGEPGNRGSSGAPGRTGDTGLQGLAGTEMPMLDAFGPLTLFGLGVPIAAYSFGALVSTSWPTANLALYVPVLVTETFQAIQLAANNGATVSGNLDLGIYDHSGNRLVSTGSTAQAGTTTLQIISIASTQLLPGRYYLAQVLDNVTGTHRGPSATSVQDWRAMGCYQQAAAFPLPAAAVFAQFTGARIPNVIVARSPGLL